MWVSFKALSMIPDFHFPLLKKLHRLVQLGFLSPLLVWADPDLATAKRAEKLFYEKLYGDAIPLYSQLFTLSQDRELKSQWALRLATCHLEEQQPQTALALLSSLDSSSYHPQAYYLMSLAYRQLDNSAQALEALEQCCHPAHRNSNVVALEQGYHLMRMGDFAQAKQKFSSIAWQEKNSLSYVLAQLQLAKIDLIQQCHAQALQTLDRLSPYLLPHSSLYSEYLYLKGWALLAQHQEEQAALCFEKLLPKALTGQPLWSGQVITGLITSYLRQAMQPEQTDQLDPLFAKTDLLLRELIKRSPIENSYLLLSNFYLIKAKYLSDSQAYSQAQALLDKGEFFSSPDGLREALLKRAAAAPSYQERTELYEKLTGQTDFPSSFVAKVWFLKGLNDLEEGLQNSHSELTDRPQPFEQAIQAFIQSIQYETQPDQLAIAHKYLALAYIHLPGSSPAQSAWQTLDRLLHSPTLLSTFQEPEEIYCLSAWTALHLKNGEALKQALSLLEQKETGNPFWQERYLKLKGIINMQLGEWQKADLFFDQLLQDDSYAASIGEAWFWRAYCAGEQKQETLKKEYFKQAYLQDPQSPYAPVAYFHYYSFRDYMQGKRKAIKHLQAMPHLFPSHPLLISAYYLIGLHHKKDYLSEEGQIVRRKDLTTAIDAFQLAESTFDSLLEKNAIPNTDLTYYIQIRYQAQLERAQSNLAIAQKSTGGKRDIYLEYAEEVFQQLIQHFTHPQSLAKKRLVQPSSPYPKIWAEAELQLAKAYEENNHHEEAEKTLNGALEHYQQAGVAQGYGLMRVWVAKGKLAQKQANPEKALQAFIEAEKAIAEPSILNPNEKLDLWIQQSLCYQALHKLDQAMRILSRVINDDVISPLRIKAMFLRAEVYELQGRPELAIKQLEATAQKGGEWAQKAKEKLEKIYGY